MMTHSKSKPNPKNAKAALTAAFAAGTAAVIAIALVLRAYGPGNMWKGAISGGVATLIILAIVTWRSAKRPEKSTTADRATALWDAADERDLRIRTNTAAILGYLTLPITALAAVVLAIGVDTEMVMAILIFLQIGIAIIAFTVENRRN